MAVPEEVYKDLIAGIDDLVADRPFISADVAHLSPMLAGVHARAGHFQRMRNRGFVELVSKKDRSLPIIRTARGANIYRLTPKARELARKARQAGCT